MPRIVLKPKSPEYADLDKKPESKGCDMPGCSILGEHKAPKHRGLNEHYWFCLEHVREYNKAWDFFDGMAQQEVENHINNSFYGDRPTWRYAGPGSAADVLYRESWRTYHFSDDEPPQAERPKSETLTAEIKALAVLGLQAPTTLEDIKTRYKLLAKQHHPDLNKGNAQSEELLKEINMAYTILKLAYEEYRRLPDHKF